MTKAMILRVAQAMYAAEWWGKPDPQYSRLAPVVRGDYERMAKAAIKATEVDRIRTALNEAFRRMEAAGILKS